MEKVYQYEIVGCHHEGGEITKVKYSNGSVVSISDAIKAAKEDKIANFVSSYDNRQEKDVLRGRRTVVENGRLYDLPRF